MSIAKTDNVRSWAMAMQLAFIGGDLDHALHIAEDATRVLDPVQLLDEVVAPAMCHVGDLWERAMISIADEHLATATAHRFLAVVAPRLRRAAPGSRGELAVLSTPDPERHTTALLMAEAVLRGAGYRVKNLGSGIPCAALAALLDRETPDVVGLSMTLPFADELRDTVAVIAEHCPSTRIVVGGQDLPYDLGLRAEPVASLRGLVALLDL